VPSRLFGKGKNKNWVVREDGLKGWREGEGNESEGGRIIQVVLALRPGFIGDKNCVFFHM